jgi:hypothetical protein
LCDWVQRCGGNKKRDQEGNRTHSSAVVYTIDQGNYSTLPPKS